jgi:DNA repair exonuclease SbcCD ATPase subunit
MLGLLEKARSLRSALGLPMGGREELAFDPDSGITVEEQKEIRAEIERVASRSRIAVPPEGFAVRAAKRGVLFPFLVIAGAVVVLAVGLGVLYVLFQRGESQIAQEPAGNITAEGKLLAEVKKESEAKLQEKNQQITDIQGRLAQIDKQRQDLQSTMDTQVAAKEAELKANLQAELDAEKARLQKQGFSDQDIQKKLADLEAQKNSDFTKQLDAFKTQAEADRKKNEAALTDLQKQFNAQLTQANADRQQVLADARQREADLQTQLAAKTTELQAQQAQTQQQLTALTNQKAQEDLVAQQLVGLYSVAQSDISARNYTKALASLQAIGTYVNSSDVASLPGLVKRRAVDQFIVDSLSQLVKSQMDAASVDTTALVDAAAKLSDVRSRVADADAQLKAGKIDAAEKLYAQALALIPEVAKSYAYFTSRSSDADAARTAAVRGSITRAETAYAAGKITDAVASYRDALAALPDSAARLDAMVSNLASSGAAAAAQASQADQTRAAAALLSQGDAQLAQGSAADASVTYLKLLSTFPLATQAPAAAQGITRAVAAMNASAAADAKAQADSIAALNAQVASLQKSVVDGAAEIRKVKKAIMDVLGQSGDPAVADTEKLIADLKNEYGALAKTAGGTGTLQSQLDAALKANKDNEQKLTALSQANTRLQQAASAAQDAQAKAETAARSAQAQADQALKDLQAAKTAAAAGTTTPGTTTATAATTATPALSSADAQRLKKYDQLVASYQSYAQQEGAPSAAGTAAGDLRTTYGFRESFLQAASALFPQLADRMHSYDAGFLAAGQQQGRDETLKKVAGIVTSLAGYSSAADQKKYLDQQITAAGRDKPLADYLKKLQSLLSAR